MAARNTPQHNGAPHPHAAIPCNARQRGITHKRALSRASIGVTSPKVGARKRVGRMPQGQRGTRGGCASASFRAPNRHGDAETGAAAGHVPATMQVKVTKTVAASAARSQKLREVAMIERVMMSLWRARVRLPGQSQSRSMGKGGYFCNWGWCLLVLCHCLSGGGCTRQPSKSTAIMFKFAPQIGSAMRSVARASCRRCVQTQNCSAVCAVA